MNVWNRSIFDALEKRDGGTVLFLTLMFLFVRVLPLISIFEVRTMLPEAQVKAPPGTAAPGAPPVVEGGH